MLLYLYTAKGTDQSRRAWLRFVPKLQWAARVSVEIGHVGEHSFFTLVSFVKKRQGDLLALATHDFLTRRTSDNNYVTIDNKMGSLSQGPIYSITLTTTKSRKNALVKDALYLLDYYKFKMLIC